MKMPEQYNREVVMSETILIADPQRYWRIKLKSVLKSYGFRIVQTDNAMELFQFLQNNANKIHLAIVDLSILYSEEVLSLYSRGAFSGLPLIAMGSAISKKMVIMSHKLSITSILQKPLDLLRLKDTVLKALNLDKFCSQADGNNRETGLKTVDRQLDELGDLLLDIQAVLGAKSASIG
jgi:DNA-binding NtrC family response regulator